MPSRPPELGPLATAIVTLAATPDHSPAARNLLITIARLAADRVGPARYASITALHGRAYTTVAVSDDLILAVDEAQYADKAGPCLDALDGGAPVGVADIEKMVQWPGFHEAAPRMGLHASISVPLFTGRGDVVAALNIYGHDRAAMAPVIAGVIALHGHPAAPEESDTDLDPGSQDLIAGYAQALRVRADISRAIELIMAANECGREDAYLSLCITAAVAGTDLAAAAIATITRDG